MELNLATLRKQHGLGGGPENRIVRRIFGTNTGKITGHWRKLHYKKLHCFSSSQSATMTKLRRIRWAGHVSCMGETRNAHKILVRKPEVKRPFGTPRY
jgi:hypothetical protein